MNNLDINTPRGQKSLEYERKMIERIERELNVDIFETDKKSAAKCDGIMVKRNELVGVFESKCRNMSVSQLYNFGSWLITHKKIEFGKMLSEMMMVRFYGFLYLIPDDSILAWMITDKEGNYAFKFDSWETETQETINGGKAIRNNSFLPVDNAMWIHDGRD
jgi:hypothetical protein|tara:strand:+ start:1800 stop:2285 length:486 start_codon:yes stop_codon:yes gene_type:complete